MGNPRMLLIFTFATVVVVGAVVALLTGSWLVLALAVLVHLLVSAVVMVVIGRALQQRDKPDPTVEAGREQEQRAAGERAGAEDERAEDERRFAI